MTVELKAAFSERTYLAEKLLFIHGTSGTFVRNIHFHAFI